MNNHTTVMAKYSDMHTNFVKEILRQLCHPVTGITKNLSPSPVTIDDWNKCLSSVYGWVNVGIDEKTANIFHELKIGEVIPSNSADMNIYTYGFATSEIARLLGLERKKEKNYRAILNYYSFLKLINMLLNCRETEYQIKFNNSLKLIFNDINPKTFWLNILVTEQISDYLQANEIGEVIVKEGTNDNTHIIKSQQTLEENKNLPTIWEYESNNNKTDTFTDKVVEVFNSGGDVTGYEDIDDEDDEDLIEDVNYVVEDDEVCDYVTNQCEDIDDEDDVKCGNKMEELNSHFQQIQTDTDTEISETPYRLVMNNTTFLKLINITYSGSNSMYNHVNFFQLIGGESEDFSGLFGKLQI